MGIRSSNKGDQKDTSEVRCKIPKCPGTYFVAVPRTGSNSICRTLGIKHLHRTSRRLHELHDDCLFTAAFVRDTYDHVASWFIYHYKGKPRDASMRFNQWIDQGLPYSDFYPPDWCAEGQEGHIIDQSLYIDGADFVGEYESLQEDFDAMCATLGLPPKTLLHRYGVGDAQKQMRVDYRSLYNQHSILRVRKVFQRELDLLGYTF